MAPHDRERLLEALDSSGWALLIGELVETMRGWSRQLLEDPDLAEVERRGLVLALNEVKKRIHSVYEKARREMPSRLRQEVWFYRDGD